MPSSKTSDNTAYIDAGATQFAPITKSDRWALFASIVVCWLLIAFLLVFFKLNEDSQYTFTGIYGSRFHKWVGYDSALYLDMIQQSKEGAWLFENRFSPEKGTPLYLNSIWLLLGKTAALSGLRPLETFTIFRFAAVAVLLFALRRFLLDVLKKDTTRFMALFLILFCGGIGWMYRFIEPSVPDAWPTFLGGVRIELSMFLCILTTPHVCLAIALMLWIFSGLVRASTGDRKAQKFTPILAFILVTFHPYGIVIIGIVGSAFLFLLRLRDGRFSRSLLWTLALCGLAASPVIAYHQWSLNTAPDLWGLRHDNDMQPAPPVRYLMALFPLGIPAVITLYNRLRHFKTINNEQILVAVWTLLIPVMIYSYPVIPFAWKLGTAMTVPIYVLSAEWITNVLQWRRQSQDTIASPAAGPKLSVIAAVITAVTASASMVILLTILNSARLHHEPYFIQPSDVKAMRWLTTHGGPNDVILSTKWPGILMPGYASKRPLLGHYAVSVKYDSRKQYVRNLFADGDLTVDELARLKRFGVKWIYYGKEERKWWPNLTESDNIHLAYQGDNVSIYRFLYHTNASSYGKEPAEGR